MGGLLGGSSGGLSPQQNQQLQAMLKATKAPASTIPSLLLSLGGKPNLPTRSQATTLGNDARFTVMSRRGYKDTVSSSPLGDPGFGTSLGKPTLTGQTS